MTLLPAHRWAIVAIIAGVILFLSFKQQGFYGPYSDEAYYFKYSFNVLQQGPGAFHDLIRWYASKDEARIHPAPIRAGFILLGALLFKLNGAADISLLILISTFSFFIFLYVCFHFVRKYFDLDTALLTVLFLSSSPLLLGLSRHALVDSSVNMLWGLTVWLFLDVLLKPNRWSYLCFLAAFFTAISFKETTVILIPFFVIAAIAGRRKGAVIKTYQIGGTIFFPLVFIFFFYGWLYGGLGGFKTVAMSIAQTHLSSHYQNAYAFDFCSGPWFKYILDFMLLIPLETLLFIGYVGFLCVQRDSFDFKKLYFLFYFVYVYAALNSLAHSKVVRFAANLEMVIALFTVLMLVEIVRGLGNNKGRFYLIYASFGIFLFNWSSFEDLFLKTSLLDPISYYLLLFRHIIH